jgi:adenine-specific DNA-methyltransferase
MAREKRKAHPFPVGSHRHKDKRRNIPTQELRDFVTAEEHAPQTVQLPGLLYSRDPSLDPQLVWKGKDEQDRQALELPVVPVYIQEKIHPQAIVEEVRAQARKNDPEPTLDLFGDFNGIPFEELVDFYHHEQNWSNRMILGDSLLVMTSLAEKEALKGKVQTIYIDPPYGIKFGSNWQVSTRKRDIKDGKVEDLTRQPEQIRAFRDTWELGIHSYLSYLRDRLVVSRELLTESGSVFVQIGDENVHIVRCALDEVFGSENFIAQITFAKTSGSTGDFLPGTSDYLLFYGKRREVTKYRQPYVQKTVESEWGGPYSHIETKDGVRRRMSAEERRGANSLPTGSRVFRIDNLQSQSMGREKGEGASSWFPVNFEGATYRPSLKSRWKTNETGMRKLAQAMRLAATEGGLYYLRFIDDFPASSVGDSWTDTVIAGFASDKKYVVETSTKVVERCLLMTTDPGDLVLDPTCGSGTTAYVAELWGRRWITIDTSRVALALTRTRLMSARYPYYLLADSSEGIKKEAEITGKIPPSPTPKTVGDIKRGFVYKRIPHITLKSIANNEDIDVIHAKCQETLEPLRERLNKLLKKSWEEWEIPLEPDPKWSAEAAKVLRNWWEARRERQRAIDANIGRGADIEYLCDQPYEDGGRVRVTGPFTVESLSPHRVIAADEERPTTEREARREPGSGQFATMILENLKKAGVQNTRKDERLKFDRLDPYAGLWIHAEGEHTDKAGIVRRVAVSLGPEHGTVGSEQVKEAAKEALRGKGFDLLIVCGFAFDALAGETALEFMPGTPAKKKEFAVAQETRQFGKLPVLLTRMNPDLAMGDEVLKKTGAGNLFMVFGEPDLEVKADKGGNVVVEVRGVDVYDPTTGQIRSSSTDDVACWFIDTNYNGESFFVRHAYFTGAEEPYDRLKRALRAEVDEAAWSALYSTRSLPFPRPTTGKIAVKVINHYGDEVLKVYEL